MRYPYFLRSEESLLYPLFGDLNRGTPSIFDFSDDNPDTLVLDERDQEMMSEYIQNQLKNDGRSWGIGRYLEKRANLLRFFPQMIEQKRYYHLAADITAPLGSSLYAPLAGTVERSGFEPGEGNYGGFILLKHEGDFETFYSFYGHLNPDSLAKTGAFIDQGKPFARIGDFHENGNWFHHTHLQIITQKGYEQGYHSKGYCDQPVLETIEELCPNPLFLLSYPLR